MSEIGDNAGRAALSDEMQEMALNERRLLRIMAALVLVAVLLSAFTAPWRVTTGLLLGGALAFFNHHWLRTSLRAVFEPGAGSRLVAARYVLRYTIIALVVASAYALDLISLVATLAGICAFAGAVMVEAAILLFRILVNGGGD